MATLPIIETLKDKIDFVISQNKSLREDNKKTQSANARLREQNKNLTSQLEQAKERISLLELSKGFTAGGADNKQAMTRVNQLMREVDKCIEMLNGQ